MSWIRSGTKLSQFLRVFYLLMQMHKISDARSRYTCKSVVYLEETILFTNSCFLTVLGKQRERERVSLSLSFSLYAVHTHTKRDTHTLSHSLCVLYRDRERETPTHTLSFRLCAVHREREREKERHTHSLSPSLCVMLLLLCIHSK